jgi:hypothetical protein
VRRISPLTIVLKLFTVANNSKLQKPQYSAQSKKLNYASQSKPPTTILDIMSQALHAQYCIDCSAIERRGGEVDLESRREGATSAGQWEAIYCYGHAAAQINSSASTSNVNKGSGRGFFILRMSECGLFAFLRSWPLQREVLLPCQWLVAGSWFGGGG